MRKWISRCALLLAALIPLPSLAQQTAFRADSLAAPPLGYYEYLPTGYNSGTAEWPVVVFLHGLGDIGDGNDDLPKVLNTGVPQNIQNGTHYPFIVISPQSSGFWDEGSLDAMIEFIKNRYRVDLDRIYLTGASMGGGGVWDYAKVHPGKLAAILPICGTASAPDGPSLAELPTWAFHSWGDPTVSASDSVAWANEIAEAVAGAPLADVMASYPGTYLYPVGTSGATSDRDRTATFDGASWTWRNDVPVVTDSHPNLTLYSDNSHFIWGRTYGNQTVWDWLLAQDRNTPLCRPDLQIITPTAGPAQGVSFFPLQQAFDAQPVLRSGLQPAGGTGGGDVPAFTSRVGYIDFGPDWANVRITSTWTRYRIWTTGNQIPYTEVWWDDDTDTTNDGVTETDVNFNSAQSLNIGNVEQWVQDADLCSSPVAPQGRYLLLRTSSTSVTDRAKELAILGYIVDPTPEPELITPTNTGAAQGVPYFPMEDAFDAQPTLNTNDEPEGGNSGGNDAPFLGGRVGYIDFGPDWADVRITATWTRYREWSTGNQTPYEELWWDDDTDTTNDGVTETDVNFNTAQGLNTGMTEPWLQDRDLSASPVTPQGRYLLLRSPSGMTGRAKEYAIVGYRVP